MDMVVPGKRRRGQPRRRWIDNTCEDMKKYEMTSDINMIGTTDMTENRQYWQMMVNTGQQRSGDSLYEGEKCEAPFKQYMTYNREHLLDEASHA